MEHTVMLRLHVLVSFHFINKTIIKYYINYLGLTDSFRYPCPATSYRLRPILVWWSQTEKKSKLKGRQCGIYLKHCCLPIWLVTRTCIYWFFKTHFIPLLAFFTNIYVTVRVLLKNNNTRIIMLLCAISKLHVSQSGRQL